jgi:hypothetical protein
MGVLLLISVACGSQDLPNNFSYCFVTVIVDVTGQSPIRSIIDVGTCNHKEKQCAVIGK